MSTYHQMGCTHTKVSPIETPYFIVSTHNWAISRVSPCYTRAFGELPLGCNITFIMTYFVRKTHQRIFENYKGREIRKMISSANAAMNSHRYMVIHNGFGTTSKVKMWMEYDTAHSIKMNVFPLNCINYPHIPRNSLVNTCTLEPSYSIEDLPGRICIIMDLANSTKLMNSMPLGEITKLYFKIAKAVDSIVCKKYHPYARVHETAGDSMFIVVDSHYVERANMVLAIVSEIIKETNLILERFQGVYFRCGISTGHLKGGIIDGKTYRLFGSAINLAARLESRAQKNKIVISQDFYKLLESEDDIPRNVESIDIECKGFDNPIHAYMYCVEHNTNKFNRRGSFIELQDLLT